VIILSPILAVSESAASTEPFLINLFLFRNSAFI